MHFKMSSLLYTHFLLVLATSFPFLFFGHFYKVKADVWRKVVWTKKCHDCVRSHAMALVVLKLLIVLHK